MAKLLTNSSLLGGVDAFLELSVKKDVICLTRDPVGLEGVCTAGPCSWIKTLVSAKDVLIHRSELELQTPV